MPSSQLTVAGCFGMMDTVSCRPAKSNGKQKEISRQKKRPISADADAVADGATAGVQIPTLQQMPRIPHTATHYSPIYENRIADASGRGNSSSSGSIATFGPTQRQQQQQQLRQRLGLRHRQ